MIETDSFKSGLARSPVWLVVFCLAISRAIPPSRAELEAGDNLRDYDDTAEDLPPSEIDYVEHLLLEAAKSDDCGTYFVKNSTRASSMGCNATRHLAGHRIAGGYSVKPGWFPSYVRLAIESGIFESICGGTIITSRHILTASHCVRNGRSATIRVYTGITKYWDHVEEHEVEKVCITQEQVADKRLPVLDMALLRTKRPIKFNDRVQPACLQKQEVGQDQTGYTVGMGLMASRPREKPARTVQAISLKRSRCPIGGIGFTINKFSLCFGTSQGQPCQGDSGGPLYGIFDGKQYLMGMTSWGRAECLPNKPSSTVFTDVARAYPYLKESSQTCR